MTSTALTWLRTDLPEEGRPRALPQESLPLIRLDRLEPSVSLPPRLLKKMGRTFSSLELSRYPDSGSKDLRKNIGKYFHIDPDHILLGKGSDELLEVLFLAISGPLLLVDPSFAMYKNLAHLTGRIVHTVSLEKNLSLNVGQLLEAIHRHSPALVVLTHPNNPTGEGLPPEEIARIAGASPGGVLIDEAYAPFARTTSLELLGRFPNLMVLRSFSKLGLAAIRLGWLAASPGILSRLDLARLPYNVDSLLQSAGALLCREALPRLESRARQTAARRERLFDALGQIPGLRPFPSEANFLLFRTESMAASRVESGLRARGIAIRDMSPDHPLLRDCLRVTIGERNEIRVFLEALSSIMKGSA